MAPVVRSVRVAVFSRHELTRAGLTRMLSGSGGAASSPASSTSATSTVSMWSSSTCAGQNGPVPDDLAFLLAAGVPVVALTSYERSHLAETALAMGAADIVHPDIDADGLLGCARTGRLGDTTTLVAYRRRHSGTARAGVRLTDRETSILELVGAGLLNQDIADRLYLSVNTVKTYIRTAYRKIGVTRRADAVLWAVHHGLTPRQPL